MSAVDHGESKEGIRAAKKFAAFAAKFAKTLPPGRGFLADRLQESANSIPLCVAEGAENPSLADGIRQYSIARRAAKNCSAILDLCGQEGLIGEERYRAGRRLLAHVTQCLSDWEARSRRLPRPSRSA